MFGGVTRNGIATGASIGAGPRDGRMTGIAARGRSLPVVRSAIGLTVLGAGWPLGGTAGIGTVVDVVAIGALAHVFIALFTAHRAPARPSVTASIAPSSPHSHENPGATRIEEGRRPGSVDVGDRHGPVRVDVGTTRWRPKSGVKAADEGSG